eukprot:GDKH01016554.1.p1 GENE.GDKH01016554.1~~GDKH01016554.1.p1  ORF type:complete len:182 (+),score=23.72 GDKH01016554.1:88-633(+)
MSHCTVWVRPVAAVAADGTVTAWRDEKEDEVEVLLGEQVNRFCHKVKKHFARSLKDFDAAELTVWLHDRESKLLAQDALIPQEAGRNAESPIYVVVPPMIGTPLQAAPPAPSAAGAAHDGTAPVTAALSASTQVLQGLASSTQMPLRGSLEESLGRSASFTSEVATLRRRQPANELRPKGS